MAGDFVKLYRPELDEPRYMQRMKELEALWRDDHRGHELVHLFQDIEWLKKQGLQIEWDGRCYIMLSDFPYEDAKAHFVIIPKYGIGMWDYQGHYLPAHDEWKNDYNRLEENAWDSARQIIKREDSDRYSFNKKNTGTINYPHWHLVLL